MRYFVSVGAFTQDGLFKQQALPYDFNYKYKRFNYRANLDFDVTKTTTISVNLGGGVLIRRIPHTLVRTTTSYSVIFIGQLLSLVRVS